MVKVTNTEKMDKFLDFEDTLQTMATLANQAPVRCKSCAWAQHMPWWGKYVAPLSHLTNAQIERWSS